MAIGRLGACGARRSDGPARPTRPRPAWCQRGAGHVPVCSIPSSEGRTHQGRRVAHNVQVGCARLDHDHVCALGHVALLPVRRRTAHTCAAAASEPRRVGGWAPPSRTVHGVQWRAVRGPGRRPAAGSTCGRQTPGPTWRPRGTGRKSTTQTWRCSSSPQPVTPRRQPAAPGRASGPWGRHVGAPGQGRTLPPRPWAMSCCLIACTRPSIMSEGATTCAPVALVRAAA